MKSSSLFAVGIALIVASVSGCPDTETCDDDPVQCEGGRKLQDCCSRTKCRYKGSDEKSFECDGTDCKAGNPSAAEKAAAWCISGHEECSDSAHTTHCNGGGTVKACCVAGQGVHDEATATCRYVTSDGSEYKCDTVDLELSRDAGPGNDAAINPQCDNGSPSPHQQANAWCLTH